MGSNNAILNLWIFTTTTTTMLCIAMIYININGMHCHKSYVWWIEQFVQQPFRCDSRYSLRILENITPDAGLALVVPEPSCSITFLTEHIWPISEFPSQTCALLLLSLHSVCHVTIAHCNDSNGTDTRVRVQCNDSDVTDRKQSRVCNDSTVTDISWAIATCDGHTNCWQSKVWKLQKNGITHSKWNLIVYARTLQCHGQKK